MSLTLPENSRGPILELALPVSAVAIDIALRNHTTGKSLTINLPAAWGGDDLTLNWFRRTITDQTGADRSALLDPTDNELWTALMPFPAGSNDVTMEAATQVIESQTRSPQTVVNDAGIGSVAWSNPGNAKASDNSRASVAKAGKWESNFLKATGYGFALPPSVVLGVALNVEWRDPNQNELYDRAVRLVKGGVIGVTERANLIHWEPFDAVATYGGAADLWGNSSIAVADVSSSGFGAAFSVQKTVSVEEGPAEVDHMSMTVYYRPIVAYGAKATLRWEKGYF